MLLQSLHCCMGTSSFILFFLFVCTWYAYRVNDRKNTNDPSKRAYAPLACWRAPIVVPILLLVNIPVFLVGSLAFGIFLILFPFALLIFRKPILIPMLQKLMLKIGTALLEIDIRLLTKVGLYLPPIPRSALSSLARIIA